MVRVRGAAPKASKPGEIEVLPFHPPKTKTNPMQIQCESHANQDHDIVKRSISVTCHNPLTFSLPLVSQNSSSFDEPKDHAPTSHHAVYLQHSACNAQYPNRPQIMHALRQSSRV